MSKRITLIGLAVVSSLITACSTLMVGSTTDGQKGAGAAPVYKFAGGLALNGYDAVSYFNDGRAITGSPDFAYEWNGARWLFTSEMNRDLFMHDPPAYAPQYGGYCAWAVSHGYTAKGDPEAWKIVDSKLYLNYNKDVQQKWQQDISAYIRKGDENWPQFLINKPEHKGE